MTDFEVSRRAGMAALPLAGGLARAAGVGGVTQFDPALAEVIDVRAPIEIIASGYKWAEGPAWVKQGGYLLFSDVPANINYKWKKGAAPEVFMNPSGLAGPIPAGVREAGSNGMTVDPAGRLIMADSGTRCVAAVDLKTKEKTVLADKYDGKRFNSCNDVALHGNGTIYFTDP